MAFISQQQTQGFSVYGMQQVSYTIDGMSGKDYGAAMIAAAISQAVTFEKAAAALTAATRARMKKVTDLSNSLALLMEIVASFPTKDAKPSNQISHPKLSQLRADLLKYDMQINLEDSGSGVSRITRGNATFAQNDIQYAMDYEDNELKQDMLLVKSVVNKRDNAYGLSAEFLKKYFSVSGSYVSSFGG